MPDMRERLMDEEERKRHNAYMRRYMRQWRALQHKPSHHIDRIDVILVRLQSVVGDIDDVVIVADIRKKLAAMRKRYDQG